MAENSTMTPNDEFQKQIFDFLMESQFWSPSQHAAYQRSQLSQLLTFAHANVPFYRDRLEPVIKNDGTIDWTRWNEVPILKRQDLIDHRDAMLAPDLPPGHGLYADHEGSGTTGKPVTTRHNKLTETASYAALWRACDWHHVDYIAKRLWSGWAMMKTSAHGPRDCVVAPGDRRGMRTQPKANSFKSTARPPKKMSQNSWFASRPIISWAGHDLCKRWPSLPNDWECPSSLICF